MGESSTKTSLKDGLDIIVKIASVVGLIFTIHYFLLKTFANKSEVSELKQSMDGGFLKTESDHVYYSKGIDAADWRLDDKDAKETRVFRRHITFTRTKFTSTPNVIVSLSGFDFGGPGHAQWLFVNKEHENQVGFDIVFSASGDTYLDQVAATWIAVGK